MLVFVESVNSETNFEPLLALEDVVSQDEWVMLAVVGGGLLVTIVIIIGIFIYCCYIQGSLPRYKSQKNIAEYGDIMDVSDESHSEVTKSECLEVENETITPLSRYEDFLESLKGRNHINANKSVLSVISLETGQYGHRHTVRLSGEDVL